MGLLQQSLGQPASTGNRKHKRHSINLNDRYRPGHRGDERILKGFKLWIGAYAVAIALGLMLLPALAHSSIDTDAPRNTNGFLTHQPSRHSPASHATRPSGLGSTAPFLDLADLTNK